jgi:L-lactate dehydrogenase complex protein LldG
VSDAREEILRRIRAAVAEAPVPSVSRDYRRKGEGGTRAVELFCERASDYGAAVHRLSDPAQLDARISERCEELGVGRLAVAAEAPWRPHGVEVVLDHAELSAEDLDALDGALTGCALAIAETGTLVLDGSGRCGRRALTLVPDLHLCAVEVDQLVASVPEAIAGLAGAADEGRPLTFVSGPSATSDIELQRVEGVHGPRRLELFVVGEAPPAANQSSLRERAAEGHSATACRAASSSSSEGLSSRSSTWPSSSS